MEKTLADPKILESPNDYYSALRAGDPVHYDAALGMYLVSRYEDLQTVLRDPVLFSQELGWNAQFAHGFFEEFKEILIKEGGGYFPDVILQDPPKHTRIRRLLEKAFTAHRVKLLEGEAVDIVQDILDKLTQKAAMDGVKDFAVPMTINFICKQLGFENADPDKIQQWSKAYTDQVGRMQSREEMLKNAKLICELQNFIIDHIRKRQEERREDMISDLIDARLDDSEEPVLAFEEIVALVRALLVGGNDTTVSALSNMFYCLATQPVVAQSLFGSVDDGRMLSRFVEELLRLEPPVRGLSRVTTDEVELGGKQLPKGAHLLLLFASGNDDEKVFECPRKLDISRRNVGKHLSFGAGVHLCVGMSLARMELKVALREILSRLKDIRLAVPEEDIQFVPSIATRTMKSLPLIISKK